MISCLQIHSDTAAFREGVFPWLDKIRFLAANPCIEFKPGLNILFGPNGSGKSTIVSMLGLYMAAVQGGRSCITKTWLQEIYKTASLQRPGHGLPFHVVHDGQPILMFDARREVGMAGGTFDDDFIKEGIESAQFRGSAGERTLKRIEPLRKILQESKFGPTDPEADPRIDTRERPRSGRPSTKGKPRVPSSSFPRSIAEKTGYLNSLWSERLVSARDILCGSIERGPRTILLDEPESGFSLEWQRRLWRGILGQIDPAKDQVIAATHSVFALGLEGANYIETEPGYMRNSLESLKSLF